ncbi:hypothetical protein [Ancylobacter sp. IITR112]|uniref:hypothetical protein n=1 Tax=Ancylobacter sp. IITR112 TaxID=3138073 RepID=UPI00352A521B
MISAAEPRFYFRVLDDVLFVFDQIAEMAHALNAPAARLFLSLPEQFTAPAALGEGTAALDAQDVHACLGAWEDLGWIERDGAGRVRLRPAPAGATAPPPAAPLPESRPAELLQQCQVRLAETSVVLRLLTTGRRRGGTSVPGCMQSRLATGERLMGFFSGFLDPAPARHPVAATLDVIVEEEGFTLRCVEGGAVTRRLFTDEASQAVGKSHLWLLDLVYRDPPPAMFVHAAALSTADGTLMMAGISGAGKSTLSAYLVARGWRFGTDDCPAIAFAGGEAVVLPCPGAINLKSGSLDVLAPFYPGLADQPRIGAGEKRGCYLPVPLACHMPPAGPENRLACLVFPRFEAGRPTEVEPIGPARALLELMDAEFGLAEPAGAAELDAFFDTLERLPRYAVVYSDLAEMESVLRRLLEQARG